MDVRCASGRLRTARFCLFGQRPLSLATMSSLPGLPTIHNGASAAAEGMWSDGPVDVNMTQLAVSAPPAPPTPSVESGAAKAARNRVLRTYKIYDQQLLALRQSQLHAFSLSWLCVVLVAVDPTKTMDEAFTLWMATQPRAMILPDKLHAEVIEVLSSKQTKHASYIAWKRRGFFTRATQGITTLHTIVKVQKAKPRGKSAQDAIDIESGDEQEAAAASSTTAATVVRRVPRQSEVLEIIRELHERRLHPGARTTYAALLEDVDGIPRAVVEAFVARCLVCTQKAAKKSGSKAAIKGIYSSRVNERCQMDLFDMQQAPGGPNKVCTSCASTALMNIELLSADWIC